MTNTEPTHQVAAPHVRPDAANASQPLVVDALRHLVADIVPHAAAALIIGSNDDQLVRLVASRVSRLDLLGGVSRGSTGAPGRPENVAVTTSQTLSTGESPGYDVVLVLDALDGDWAASFGDGWSSRLTGLARLVAAGGTFAVRAASPGQVAMALGYTTPGGSSDGPPGAVATSLVDPTSPASPDQLVHSLAVVGHHGVAVHCLYGGATPSLVLLDDVATSARPGELTTALVAGLSPDAVARAVPPLARAGLLPLIADSWLAVSSGRGRPVYAQDERGNWLGAELSASGTGWLFQPIDEPLSEAPRLVGAGANLESELRTSLLGADLTRFRQLAQALAQWAEGSNGSLPTFENIYVEGSTLSAGIGSERLTDPGDADHNRLVARGWLHFADRLAGAAAPWDAWKDRRSVIVEWLTFSSVAGASDVLASLEASPEQPELPPEPNDVETTAASLSASVPTVATRGPGSEASERPGPLTRTVDEVEELVRALREALAVRDRRLRHREGYIRRLRHEWLETQRELDEATRETERLRGSRTYRTGARVELARQPRKLASAAIGKAGTSGRRLASIARRR